MQENAGKKLFLLDAYALIFRSYYAFIKNPRINSSGLNTSAIFGFTLTLEELLQKQNPTHLAVVFDPPSPTFRHEMYSDYKANRDATPEDIKLSVPWIKELLKAYNIPVYEVDGFEADDVIGTLAMKASEQGFETFMMTPDKDFAQLVKENVKMYKPARGGAEAVVWGPEEVKREFSVADPLQVIDILALMGDSADNIPGAPGIGPKTAMKLISEFGSVENLLKNTAQLKGKQREILEENGEGVLFSKKLVVIETNVPVELRTMAAKLEAAPGTLPPDGQASPAAPAPQPGSPFQGSLFGDPTPVESKEVTTLAAVDHDYRLVDGEKQLKSLVDEILTLEEFCFDTETTSVEPLEAELVAIAFSWKKGA